MRRLIDADVLIEKCGEWYVEEGPKEGFIGTIKQLLESQPIVHVSDKDADTISRQAAIEDVGDGVYTGSKIRRWLKSLPSVQPKGTRLSTVCLLCKKPAVTFNTEDDIPYTNYSYCEDCLRKGLKLLREQNKNLQTQPERKIGRWITDDSELGIKCNKCGKSFSDYVNAGTEYMFLEEIPNFCPNCCEDMRSEG